jgi:hypothetical protein
MTVLVVCLLVALAWLCVNLATLIWLAGISDEQMRQGERLDALEGLRGGLDITPPPDREYLEPRQLVCRKHHHHPKES